MSLLPPDSIIPSWLSALFLYTEGKVCLQAVHGDDPPVIFTDDLEEIASFIGEHGAVDLDLKTDQDYAGFSITSPELNVDVAYAATLEPSLVVKEGVQLFNIYLLRGEGRKEIVAKIYEKFKDAGSGFVPLPIGDARIGPDDTEAIKDAGSAVIYYSAEEIEAGFFGVHPGAVPEDEKFNDAEVIHGERIDAKDLNTEVKICFGANREAKRWKPLADKVILTQFIDAITKHIEGEKDGVSFMQGVTPTGERKNHLMTEMSVVGLDMDCGVPMAEIVNMLDKLGLLAICYTTHSHLGTTSEINDTKYLQFARQHNYPDEPSKAAAGHFMREVKFYTEAICNSVTGVDKPEGSLVWTVTHAPMERFRVILPLSEPYVFADQKQEIGGTLRRMTQPESTRRWRNKILGLAEILKVRIDQSCTDPARLFYLPRHKKGDSRWQIKIIGGKTLDLALIPEKNKQVVGATEDNVYSQAASDIMDRVNGTELQLPSGNDLRDWAKAYSKTFQITRLFTFKKPDLIRMQISPTKFEVMCPFDDEHSNPGDEKDRGTFVCDGGAEDFDGAGFQFKCQHNHCADHDRLKMLRKAIDNGWFEEADLHTADFNDDILSPEEVAAADAAAKEAVEKAKAAGIEQPKTAEDRRKTEEERLKRNQAGLYDCDARLKTFDENTEATEIEKLINDLVFFEGSEGMILNAINTIKKKCKSFDKADLKKLHESAKKKIAAQREQEGKKSREEEVAEIRCDPRFEETVKEKLVIFEDSDYHATRKIIADAFKTYNKKGEKTSVFRFSDERVRCSLTEDGTAEISKLNRGIITSVFNDAAVMFGVDDDGNKITKRLADFQADDLIAAKEQDIFIPKLSGFASQPFFSASGELVKVRGYHLESETMLNLSSTYTPATIPDTVTPKDVEFAKHELMEKCFVDFPFDDGKAEEDIKEGEDWGAGSRAHFMALLLQPIVRPMIRGNCPFFFVTKPMMATGATLLVESALHISTGQKGAGLNYKRDTEAMEKLITAKFRSASNYIWIDNVSRRLDGDILNNLATLAYWEDRVLGQSTIVKFPNRMQTIVSGINVGAAEETARRCVPIFLNAKGDPRKRDKTKFAIPNLAEFITQNQRDLHGYCLTIVKNWVAKGQKPYTGAPLTSFDHWSEVMGGILESAGIKGFLTNLHLMEEADKDRLAWGQLCHIWHEKFKFGKAIVKDLRAELQLRVDELPEVPGVFATKHDEEKLMNQLMAAIRKKRSAAVEMIIDGKEVCVFIRNEIKNNIETFWLEEGKN